MAKLGEGVLAQRLKQGVEEIHSVVTGNPVQAPTPAPEASPEAARPSYERVLQQMAKAGEGRESSSKGLTR